MSNLKEELNNYKDKKSSYKYIGLLIIVFVIATLIYMFFPKSDSQKVEYITSKVKTGDLMVVVSASGNIKPTNSVEIGIEVSGTIKEIFVDFNDEVKVGQVLAKIDTTKLEAQVESSRAALDIAKANQIDNDKLFIHAFTDGRDCDPKSGAGFLRDLQQHLNNSIGTIASVCGRY